VGARPCLADLLCASPGLAYFGFRFAMMTFLLDGPILFGARRASVAALGLALAENLSLPASVLVHELCHCAVAHYYGATISHLSLWCARGAHAPSLTTLTVRSLHAHAAPTQAAGWPIVRGA